LKEAVIALATRTTKPPAMYDADELGSSLCYRTRKFWTQLTLLGNPRDTRATKKRPEDESRFDRNTSLCVIVLRKR